MKKIPFVVLFFCFVFMLAAQGQQSLDNSSIIKMVKSGLSDDLIVQMIQSQPGQYALSADDIVGLKKSGVSENVLKAMIGKGSVGAAPAVSGGATGASGITEVGLYYKKDGAWSELLPEVVNWKTGGTWKNIGSVGIVKKDVNGNIVGPHSLNSIKGSFEFMIYAPEGVTYTEYQLLKLRPNKNGTYREFRTITGGVFNQSSGARRDMLPFEAKKVEPRKYHIVLPNTLGPGEYGFIHMGAAGASGGMSSMAMGKMYTFRIPE